MKNLNFEFLLSRISRQDRVLDFGCGDGSLVNLGRARGFDLWGADVFYGGARSTAEGVSADTNGFAKEIRNGRIPFPDGSFDAVISSSVFEHVADLEAVLREIHRVLAPDGRLVTIFPSKGCFREQHCGVPFVHWLPESLRYTYLLRARKLGLGKFTADKTDRQWAKDFCEWIKCYTFYRTDHEIKGLLRSNGFTKTDSLEGEYAMFRAGILRSVVSILSFLRLAKPIVNFYGCLVIQSRTSIR